MTDCKVNSASIVCSYWDKGENEGYPFAFFFQVKIKIHDVYGLEVEMKFENKADRAIPAGIGWHPYFKLHDNINRCYLQLPKARQVEIDEQMIPTGNKLAFDSFETKNQIEHAQFDSCFRLRPVEDNKTAVKLWSHEHELTYWQDYPAFPYLQVFVPPMRNCIAFEPMSCNIDAFNNGEDLAILQPGESISGKCGVHLTTHEYA